MEYAVSDRDLKRLPQIRLKLIDISIKSYCYILNSPRQLEQISQEDKLSSALCNSESDYMRGK